MSVAGRATGPVLAREELVECWIGVVTEGGRRSVRVAGRLNMSHVAELLMACADTDQLEIDLNDLVSADAAAVDALRRLRGTGATLAHVPGYIQLKLDAPSG